MAAGLKELAGEILARLEKGEGALLETQIRKEGLSRRLLPWSGEGFSCMLAGEEGVVLEPVVPEPRLLILGAGHISLALAEFAARAACPLKRFSRRWKSMLLPMWSLSQEAISMTICA